MDLKDLNLICLKGLVILLILSFVFPFSQNVFAAVQADVVETLPESNDFATQVLNDPWDMEEFTDISQRLNYAGSSNEILNIDVSNGVFSGTAEGNYSEFFPLFSGWTVVLHGKVGELYPIETNTYQCFYMSMKTDKRTEFHVFSAKDRTFLQDIVSVEKFETYWNFSEPSDFYQLQKINLSQTNQHFYQDWTYLSQWKALRINPVLYAPGTNFSIDWIRLTDCDPVYLTIDGLDQNKSFDVWLEVGNPVRTLLAEKNISSNANGQLLFDTQGLEANTYTYHIKDTGTSTERRSGQFIVNAQPQVDILHPSPVAGEDFATSKGSPWDMSGSEDVWAVRNTSGYAFENGLLKMYTNPGTLTNIPDPIVYLSIPDTAAPADYRYLNFKIFQNGDIAQPGEGMIVRWIWIVNQYCDFVGLDIPLDVGWNTVSVDLYDSNNGMPVGNDCGAINQHWTEFTSQNVNFRFDPNENVTGYTFYQELDWIKLTKEDRVTAGQIYTIEYRLSEEELSDLTFYYTTDKSQPMQHLANEYITPPPSGGVDLEGPYFLYLPSILKNYVKYENPIFRWDTTSVSAGEYYICSVSDDGYNQAVDCSEAPLLVQ